MRQRPPLAVRMLNCAGTLVTALVMLGLVLAGQFVLVVLFLILRAVTAPKVIEVEFEYEQASDAQDGRNHRSGLKVYDGGADTKNIRQGDRP